MNNLIANLAYEDLVSEFDQRLWKLLGKLGDDFKPAQWYIDRWNQKPGAHGSIPYDQEGNEPPKYPRLTTKTLPEKSFLN